jgi:hypothetical protein
MKYLLVSLVIAGTLLTGVPCFADTGAGVSIPLTVTVTGGSSGGGGGGGWGGSNGSFPYTPPNWASIFPSMNQPQSSGYIDNRPVAQNPPIYIPPVMPQSTVDKTFPAHGSQIEVDPNKEPFKVDWFLLVCLGLILISGTIVVILLVRSRRKY